MDEKFLRRQAPWNGTQLSYQPNALGEIIVSALGREVALGSARSAAELEPAQDANAYADDRVQAAAGLR